MQKKKAILIDLISISFIVLFIYAATSKIFDYQNFIAQLGRSPLLARFWGWYWVVPALEIVIAILLPISQTRLLGLYASFSLMTMFSAYIFIIMRFSEFIPCSCGGILQHMSWGQHFWFNIIFVLLGLVAIILKSQREKLSL